MLPKLTKLLECPICYNAFTLPVALCRENGHAICRNCKSLVDNCPYCKSQWSLNRNILMNEILQVLLQSCHCCLQTVEAKTMEEHQKKFCRKRTMQCFIFCRGRRCSFIFSREELINHLLERHCPKKWKIHLGEMIPIPIRNILFTKNFCFLFECLAGKSRRPSVFVLLRVFCDRIKRLFYISANILDSDVEELEQFVFTFQVMRRNKVIESYVTPCLPISDIPEEPDRFPGCHREGRIQITKADAIFSDPSPQHYHFLISVGRS